MSSTATTTHLNYTSTKHHIIINKQKCFGLLNNNHNTAAVAGSFNNKISNKLVYGRRKILLYKPKHQLLNLSSIKILFIY